MIPFHLWLDRVALRPPPKIFTAEGDEVLLAKTAFDILDGQALSAALAAHPALERHDDGGYTWFEAPERALERAQARPRPEEPSVPPEVQAQVAREFMEQHYRTWPDQPLPALGDRTPREAAALESARPRLISLLKQMEVMAERDRRAGRPAYDFTWMWAELGLVRPG